MKEEKITVNIRVFANDELTELESSLRQAAIEATDRAYAPYSNFYVGAAALLENGEVITGNNQENAAYPSGLCAERVTLFYAGSKYPDVPVEILAIAVMAGGQLKEDISPCGGCRQVLLETEERGGKPMKIMLCGKDNVKIISSAADLLPLSFGKNELQS